MPKQKRKGERSRAELPTAWFSLLRCSRLACSGRSRAGGWVQLEFHQLELRYERLRIVRPEQERRLLASLADVGQQVAIVVVQQANSSQHVVIDGYKRIRGLRRLHRDTVEANSWPGEEVEALIITRLMQTAETETALEQSWLLLELKQRFGFSLEELARRFGHSVSASCDHRQHHGSLRHHR